MEVRSAASPAAASVSTAGAASERARLESIDVVRGVIMIIMALDHTRDFFGVPGQNPTDLASATAALFFTRWVTFFCAPVFFLLTGTGAFLSLRRRSPGELSRFLLTRGLWLIFLELVLVRCVAYQFNVDYRVTMLLVLWALGWSMIRLSALVRLPAVVDHRARHPHDRRVTTCSTSVKSTSPLWSILHAPGVVLATPEHVVFAAYPLDSVDRRHRRGIRPRTGLRLGPERRRAWLLRLGLALRLAFLVIRGLNVYGDPARWMRAADAAVHACSRS